MDSADYVAGAALTGVATLAVVVSIRAPDSGQAVLGVAAVISAATWLLADRPAVGIAVLNPAWAVVLLLRRRLPGPGLLPTWAAAAVGALAFGALGGWVIDDLPPLLVQDQPDLVPAAAVLAVTGALSAWVVSAAANRTGQALLTAAPILVAATALPAAYTGALNPAVLFGLGVAGVASWTYVYVGALAVLAGSIVGGFTAGLVAGRAG